MGLIQLDKEYLTGIALLDGQHRNLVRTINTLYSRIFECEDLAAERELTAKTLDSLLGYVDEHFTAEETLMVKCHYPGYDDHRREHDAFRSHVLNLQRLHKSGQATLSFSTFVLIRDWVKNHLMETDAQYVPFFRERGIL